MTAAHLEALGWTVITIWECELRKNAGVNEKLNALTAEIVRAGEVNSQRETEKIKTKMEAMKEREEILRRHVMLEAEIEAFSLPPRAIIETEANRHSAGADAVFLYSVWYTKVNVTI